MHDVMQNSDVMRIFGIKMDEGTRGIRETTVCGQRNGIPASRISLRRTARGDEERVLFPKESRIGKHGRAVGDAGVAAFDSTPDSVKRLYSRGRITSPRSWTPANFAPVEISARFTRHRADGIRVFVSGTVRAILPSPRRRNYRRYLQETGIPINKDFRSFPFRSNDFRTEMSRPYTLLSNLYISRVTFVLEKTRETYYIFTRILRIVILVSFPDY